MRRAEIRVRIGSTLFIWHGGEYAEIFPGWTDPARVTPADVINLWDHEAGVRRVPFTPEALEREALQWARGNNSGVLITDPGCPACGDPADFCQGHGEIGDPEGRRILDAHDNDDHSGCRPGGCDEAER